MAAISRTIPQELLVEILLYEVLSDSNPSQRRGELTRVCKEWDEALNDPLITFSLLSQGGKVSERALRNLSTAAIKGSRAWTDMVHVRLAQAATPSDTFSRMANWLFAKSCQVNPYQAGRVEAFVTWFKTLPQGSYKLVRDFDFTNLSCHKKIYIFVLCQLTNLESLRFNESAARTDAVLHDGLFSSLLLKTPKLRTLSIEHAPAVSAKAFTSLKELTPTLTALEVRNCQKVQGVFHALLPLIGKLRRLVLENIPIGGDIVLQADFLRRATGMTHLTLPSACQVDEPSLLHFVGQNRALEHLALPGQAQITDRILYRLADECPSLKALDVSYCKCLNSSAMITLVGKCRKISSLVLQGLPRIGGEVLLSIRRLRCRIMHLDVSHCPSIHLKDVTSLRRALPPEACIRYDDIGSVPGLVVAQFQAMRLDAGLMP